MDLGRACAERLSAEGVRVTVCARREGHLREVAAAIEQATGHEILAIPLDVAAPESASRLIGDTVERFGRLDILVNNAGTSAAGSFEKVTDELWADDFDVKLFGAVRCAREAIPHMRRQGGGRIVNILNTGAKVPRANTLPTAAARAAGAGVHQGHLAGVCAGEYPGQRRLYWRGAHGAVGTAVAAEDPELSEEEFYEWFAKDRAVPVGRVAHASELADLVTFLVSARASYISGTAINFDGGATPVS